MSALHDKAIQIAVVALGPLVDGPGIKDIINATTKENPTDVGEKIITTVGKGNVLLC